ncbi:MAG: oxidoreductase [Maritimibacter sp.]|nr:oxidoreductase [Maritimibacter sp.]
MTGPVLGVIGIDHRHIYEMLGMMIDHGCTGRGWWTEGQPGTQDGFVKRFPDLPRVDDPETLLADPDVDMILLAGVPSERAEFAIRAMRAGKDVMVDKPGCTTMEQLAEIRKVQAETGRIWSVNYSEHFQVASVTKAAELIAAGAIGKVIQTAGFGPHRLNRPTRPDWFFDEARYGGILCDIGSHQIEQFLFFTGSDDAEIVTSTVANFANPDDPGLQDFGEILIRGDGVQGYVRIDWYTPDALPTWGDGRLTILGTEGYIELRKYVDITGREGKDHLFLVNGDSYEHIDASGAGLPYFAALIADVRDRTETAMPQARCFKAMELALRAQAQAARLGNLS